MPKLEFDGRGGGNDLPGFAWGGDEDPKTVGVGEFVELRHKVVGPIFGDLQRIVSEPEPGVVVNGTSYLLTDFEDVCGINGEGDGRSLLVY